MSVSSGNAEDGTQRRIVPTSVSPRWQEGTGSAGGVHTLRFALPEGLGPSRAVSLELRRSGLGAVVTSNTVLFSYSPPRVSFVELRPLDEAFLQGLPFTPRPGNTLILVVHGENFGPPASVRVPKALLARVCPWPAAASVTRGTP